MDMRDSKKFSSSSFFSNDASFPFERDIGILKPESEKDCSAGWKPSEVAEPNSVDSKAFNFHDHSDAIQGRKVRHEQHAAVFDRAVNKSITVLGAPGTTFNSDVCKAPSFGRADSANMTAVHSEYSLFSSSLSELISKNLRLATDSFSGNSIGTVTSYYEENEIFEASREIETQTIGKLLPDEDDLFTCVANWLDDAAQTSSKDDSEEPDLFSSIGGIDLGDDGSSVVEQTSRNPVRVLDFDIEACKGSMAGEHPDTEQRCGCLDVENTDGKESSSAEDTNQGQVVPSSQAVIAEDEFQLIFGANRDIKIHQIPLKGKNEVSEVYDASAAETSFHSLDGSDISRKRIGVDLGHSSNSKSSGQQFSSDSELDGLSPASPQSSNVMAYGLTETSPLHRRLSSAAITEFIRDEIGGIQSGNMTNQHHLEAHVSVHGNSHSFSESDSGQNCDIHHNSPDSVATDTNIEQPEVICNRHFCRDSSDKHTTLNNSPRSEKGSHPYSAPGNLYGLEKSCQTHPLPMTQFNSPFIVNDISHAHFLVHLNPFLNPTSLTTHMVLPMDNHIIGSAPCTFWSPWDYSSRAYAGEAHKASGYRLGCQYGMRNPRSFLHHCNFPRCISGSMVMPTRMKGGGKTFSRGEMASMVNLVNLPSEHYRNRRSERRVSQTEQKLFELDVNRIMQGEDSRTTVMIKNIPNKYTSKMLLATIDERHKGTYDFFYLPIDFKNRCNVGYAFINMTDPSLIIPFYQTFNGKKWEKFNSEKVASLAYARIQGRAALIAHFQNSSLMNEDKQCRPILFNAEGPRAGDQVPFPVKNCARSRPNKAEIALTHSDHRKENPKYIIKEEESGEENASSASANNTD